MTAATDRTAPWLPGGAGSVVAALLFVLGLLLAYRVSFVHPLQGLNITPWNPPAALSVALLVWRPRWWWLAWLALVAADATVREALWQPASEIPAAGVLVASHALAAQALRRGLGSPPDLAGRREVALLLAVCASVALLDAVAYLGTLRVLGGPAPDAFAEGLLRYWIGDAVGLLVVLPLLFVLGHPARRGPALAMLRRPAWWTAAALSAAACALVFLAGIDDPFKYFYLLFLPVVWAAARFGLTGAAATAALVQGLLMGALQHTGMGDVAVFEFQLLMAALALTALLLGAAVDEREAAARSLAASLRLAAAGDSAAAIAHELSQPLAALGTYATATQWLVRALPAETLAARPQLAEAAARTVDEARRAGEVVQRLRGFLGERTMEMRHADLGALLGRVLDSRRPRAGVMGVALQVGLQTPRPSAWVDPVQIEVVLRNLVDNAIEAAAAGDAPRQVTVALSADAAGLQLAVRDSGAGVPAQRLAAVFAPQVSDKPGGMGIGLSLSRAIVQAHDGRLWAEPGPGGAFFVTLPAAGETPDA